MRGNVVIRKNINRNMSNISTKLYRLKKGDVMGAIEWKITLHWYMQPVTISTAVCEFDCHSW